jgi:hypothetical protein
MAVSLWITEHWFELLSAIGIIASLCFTAASFYSEAKTRRVANLLTLTENHRQLLKVFYENVKLTRILDPKADVASFPVNRGEEIYVGVIIQHLSSVYRAMRSDLTMQPKAIRHDVREFFGLPVPKVVWKKLKPFQDDDFARFVEECQAEAQKEVACSA